MTDPPLQQSQPYGVVRTDGDEILIDVSHVALTRALELLNRCPTLLGVIRSASAPRVHAHARGEALVALLGDPQVREAATVRLSVEDAVQLATEIIAAATPNHSPGRTRVSVSGRGNNETTDQDGKDAR